MSNPSFIADSLQALIDKIEMTPDSAARLAAYSYLMQQFRNRVPTLRDKAAYEARLTYSVRDVVRVTGCRPPDITVWASTHRVKNSLPPLPRNSDRHLDNAKRITSAGGYDRDGIVGTYYASKIVEEHPADVQPDRDGLGVDA